MKFLKVLILLSLILNCVINISLKAEEASLNLSNSLNKSTSFDFNANHKFLNNFGKKLRRQDTTTPPQTSSQNNKTGIPPPQTTQSNQGNLSVTPPQPNAANITPAAQTTSTNLNAANQNTGLINSLNYESNRGYDPAIVAKWGKLFNSTTPPQPCPQNGPLKSVKNADKFNDAFLEDRMPQIKPDVWSAKKFGNGDAAYFFDYIDVCFRKLVVDEFKQMFDRVKKFQYNEDLDPYSPLKLLAGYNALGNGDKIDQSIFQANDEAHKQKALKAIEALSNGTFKADLYNAGIAMPQFDQVFSNFKWDLPKHNKPTNVGYYEFNKYDFNGDGRLSPREFILFALRHNKDYFGKIGKGVKEYMFNGVVDDYLQPFFYFADCDNDGLITAENIWNSSLDLKCAASQSGYKLNSCPVDEFDSNVDYKTNSCSDIVLNNESIYDGRLTLNDWSLGILMGFWDRQTSDTTVEEGDNRNLKSLRWGNNGATDLECEKQNKFGNDSKK